jgi:hypothetical protein
MPVHCSRFDIELRLQYDSKPDILYGLSPRFDRIHHVDLSISKDDDCIPGPLDIFLFILEEGIFEPD